MRNISNTESFTLGLQSNILNQILGQVEINAKLGTFYWNIETGDLFYSDNFYRLLDCEPGEFTPNIEYFNNHFLHPEDYEKISGARDEVLEKKEGDTWEYRIISKKGVIKYVKAISKTIRIENHNFLIGTIQDITKDVLKIKQVEKRQDELITKTIELKNYIRIIEHAEISAGLGHWHINLDTNEFHMSENMYNIVGIDITEDVSFEKVLNFIHPDDRQNLIENSINDYKQKKTSISVFRIIQSDGKIKYIKGSSNKHKIHRITFLVGVAHDITYLIDKEIVLEEKNLQLERQNDELASFNHMASHDLQEPLRKIQVLSKLILENDETKLSETSVNYFNRILHAAVRMQNLINDLLDYSSTNDPKNTKVVYKLDNVLQDTLTNFKEDISHKKAKIKSDPLPTLRVVPSQVQQLFNNLIGNALKYSKRDVPPEITITTKIIPGELITGYGLKKIAYYHSIMINDNGIGFDQKYEHKIFDIFQRLHGKNEYSGTGIGLTICKKVMQNHNGYITASGVPDQGAIFTLYFPVED